MKTSAIARTAARTRNSWRFRSTDKSEYIGVGTVKGSMYLTQACFSIEGVRSSTEDLRRQLCETSNASIIHRLAVATVVNIISALSAIASQAIYVGNGLMTWYEVH